MGRAASMIIVFITAACGNGSSSSSPTSSTPQIAQVAGVWRVTETVTGVTGGECFAPTFQSLVNTMGSGTIQVTQSGSSLTARFTDTSNGASCDYVGTASANTVVLNTVSCTASDIIGATCPSGGDRRDVRLQTGGYNVTVSGNSLSGTGAQTYNVNIAGTSTPVGTLTLRSSFSATRQ